MPLGRANPSVAGVTRPTSWAYHPACAGDAATARPWPGRTARRRFTPRTTSFGAIDARGGPSSVPVICNRARGSASLTPQQRQIALLAAAGHTNKEIAARLFLSPRTVSTHLYQVFPKLGITSRAALRDALADIPPE
jgi:DNA-binding CsgD family transcriptional regulator